MAHIAAEVVEVLTSQGFQRDGEDRLSKRVATGGQFGVTRVFVRVVFDRYLERVDGWGTVERDVDLRNYAGRAADAVADVLTS